MKVSRVYAKIVMLFCLLFIIDFIYSDWVSDLKKDIQKGEKVVKKTVGTAEKVVEKSAEDVKKTFANEIEQVTKSVIKSYPHQHDEAKVRKSEDISGDEKSFVQKRISGSVVSGLKKFLNDSAITESEAPIIAFCGSGGGVRALLFSLGAAKGAQDIGLMSCVTYAAGLSGSTWFLAPWISGGVSLSELLEKFKSSIANGLQPELFGKDAGKIIGNYAVKLNYGQPLSAIDMWGALLANTFLTVFGQNSQAVRLSEQKIDSLIYPFPIFATVRPIKGGSYEWWEVTPYEVGRKDAYVPTWAFGRKFENDKSQDYAAEQTLGMFIGIFESAFEGTIKDASPKFVNSLKTAPLIGFESVVAKSVLVPVFENVRMSPAVLPSFVTGKDNLTLNYNNVILVDAGISFNLPTPPLLRKNRNVDIIFIIDGSATIMGTPELKKAEQYARDFKLKFPEIDYKKAESDLISVHVDKDSSVPVVVYYKRGQNPDYKIGNKSFDIEECVNKGACKTTNFKFSSSDVDDLVGLSEFTIKQYKNLIQQTIKDVVARKRKK